MQHDQLTHWIWPTMSIEAQRRSVEWHSCRRPRIEHDVRRRVPKPASPISSPPVSRRDYTNLQVSLRGQVLEVAESQVSEILDSRRAETHGEDLLFSDWDARRQPSWRREWRSASRRKGS